MVSPGVTMPPADELALGFSCQGPRIEFVYDIDGRFSGNVAVTYPFDLDTIDEELLPSIGVGVAAFLGQLCLARKIELRFPIPEMAASGILPLAEMLYDVRCWKDRLPLTPPPIFTSLGHSGPAIIRNALDQKRACLLWSGGKDSTFGAMVLQMNGFDVRPLHVTANIGVEYFELQATQRLALRLGLRPQILGFQFPEYLRLSSAYARNWNQFPYCNTVAFGRDMLLSLLATLLARRLGASAISLGHDHDCRTAYIRYQNKIIPRNDVESAKGALVLGDYIRRFLLPGVRLLPPLATMSEYRILYEMLTKHPDLMGQISFCFWGNNCGRCSKCLRYYLAQRVLGREDVLSFQSNPLFASNCPELGDYVNGWRDESLLFRQGVLYCLCRLVQRGDIRDGEDLLVTFRDHVYPHLSADLPKMESELMAVYADPQVPPDFVNP